MQLLCIVIRKTNRVRLTLLQRFHQYIIERSFVIGEMPFSFIFCPIFFFLEHYLWDLQRHNLESMAGRGHSSGFYSIDPSICDMSFLLHCVETAFQSAIACNFAFQSSTIIFRFFLELYFRASLRTLLWVNQPSTNGCFQYRKIVIRNANFDRYFFFLSKTNILIFSLFCNLTKLASPLCLKYYMPFFFIDDISMSLSANINCGVN